MSQLSFLDPAVDEKSIIGFMSREAKRMWPTDAHRERCVSQVLKFADYRDNMSLPLSQFLPADIHDYADHLIAQGKSEATVNRHLAAISKVFNHAVDERIITQRMKIKFFQQKGVQRPRIFTDDEIEAVINFFNDREDCWFMHDLFVLGLKTGMRLGEMVLLGDGIATISDCGQWITLPASHTKTYTERLVPIKHPDAQKAAERLCMGLKDVWSRHAFYHRWMLCKRDIARGDKHFTFHVTRHTAASRMANDLKVNTSVIALALGHSSLATTQKYIKAKPDALLDISEQM